MTLPDFLMQDPDGEVRLTGHRIGLYTVVRCCKEGYSAARIAEEFPTLPLDLVQKVLAFYLANRAEVDVYVDEYRAELERQEALPPGPGVLRIRRLVEMIHKADEERKDDPAWAALSLVEKARRLEAEKGVEAG